MSRTRILQLRRWLAAFVAAAAVLGLQGASMRQLHCARARATVHAVAAPRTAEPAGASASPARADSPRHDASAPADAGASSCAPAIAALPADFVPPSVPPAAASPAHPPRASPNAPSGFLASLERPPRRA